MSALIPVCSLAEIPPGESVRVLAPHPVAIFNVDGDLYAIDDTCTHQDASLSDGWVEGCLVECPLHAAMFDLRTGVPTGLPARRPVRTWAVVLVDDVVHLDATRVGVEVREHAA